MKDPFDYLLSISLLSISWLLNAKDIVTMTSTIVGMILSAIVGYHHILKIIKLYKNEKDQTTD